MIFNPTCLVHRTSLVLPVEAVVLAERVGVAGGLAVGLGRRGHTVEDEAAIALSGKVAERTRHLA